MLDDGIYRKVEKPSSGIMISRTCPLQFHDTTAPDASQDYRTSSRRDAKTGYRSTTEKVRINGGQSHD